MRLGFIKGSKGLARWSNRLVGLLRILDLAVVASRRVGNVVITEHRSGHRTRRLDRFIGQGRRVGSHVSDPTLLVEALSGAHRPLRIEPKLSAGFNLK